jgi:hypothetical protein
MSKGLPVGSEDSPMIRLPWQVPVLYRLPAEASHGNGAVSPRQEDKPPRTP